MLSMTNAHDCTNAGPQIWSVPWALLRPACLGAYQRCFLLAIFVRLSIVKLNMWFLKVMLGLYGQRPSPNKNLWDSISYWQLLTILRLLLRGHADDHTIIARLHYVLS